MKTVNTLLAALLLSANATLAVGAEEQVYINDLLVKEPVYQQTWSKLVRSETGLPEWVRELDGVGVPVWQTKQDGATYTVSELCKAHDCANNRLIYAFTADKKQAYALYIVVPEDLPVDQAPSSKAKLRWLGKPDAAVRTLLETQLKSNPNWK